MMRMDENREMRLRDDERTDLLAIIDYVYGSLRAERIENWHGINPGMIWFSAAASANQVMTGLSFLKNPVAAQLAEDALQSKIEDCDDPVVRADLEWLQKQIRVNRLACQAGTLEEIAGRASPITIPFDGCRITIDPKEMTIERTGDGYVCGRAPSFANDRDPDRWRAAVALTSRLDQPVDLDQLLNEQTAESVRKIVSELRSRLKPLGIKIKTAGTGRWSAVASAV